MMKVMLVDDEPFILQGLEVIIDWEKEGFEIVKKAINGRDAIDYLKTNEVDLIITDIKMPEINGLELLQIVREELKLGCFMIILSGYSDFKYAKAAIKYDCVDYMLKPVQDDNLLATLRKVQERNEIETVQNQDEEQLVRSYVIQNVVALLRGRGTEENAEYIERRLKSYGEMRYVQIGVDNLSMLDELTDNEVDALKTQMYEAACRFLGDYSSHLFVDLLGYVEDYEIGFIYCDYMLADRYDTPEDFFEALHKHVQLAAGDFPVVIMAGKPIDNILRLSHSYSSADRMRFYKEFQEKKNVYIYDESMQVEQSKAILDKQSMDGIIEAIEQNNKAEIEARVNALFDGMEAKGMTKENIALNTNYLLFSLIHLAVEQDQTVNQEEVLAYINENISSKTLARGSRVHFCQFACEYADYLIQMRKNSSKGVLQEIDEEIKEHFAENLSLRELSQKYYINSSYLGQMFKKRYGQSFRDYLNTYRISEAAKLLVKTDKKISQIAEEVGYHDLDYFISKFIAQQGCTPSRYRKNAGNEGGSVLG